LSPNGEKWLKKESRINKVRYRGGNRYDLRFLDKETRDEALTRGYVQGGGIIFKLGEWTKQINTTQCHKCAKWGHIANEYGGHKRYCKYCAALNEHTSDQCPYINSPEEHRCSNCKNMPGHNATEKFECLFYIEYYINACNKEKVAVDKKYSDARERLIGRDKANPEKSQKFFDEQINLINNKLNAQLKLNKEILCNDDIDVADYTKLCEEFIDADVMKLYKKK
jgi:hypothetical protein